MTHTHTHTTHTEHTHTTNTTHIHTTHKTHTQMLTYTYHIDTHTTHTHSPRTLAAPEAASHRLEDTAHRSAPTLPEKPLRLVPTCSPGWPCHHKWNARSGDPSR